MNLDEIHNKSEEPELESVESFVQFCMDEDKFTFTHLELRALCLNCKTSGSKLRAELEAYGLTLAEREPPKTIRGFTANNNTRWAGNPCAGGSGHEQIMGFAGRRG
jgi:hypothetical protein